MDVFVLDLVIPLFRMEKTLDYNVRLAELQQNAAKLAARTLGKIFSLLCLFLPLFQLYDSKA